MPCPHAGVDPVEALSSPFAFASHVAEYIRPRYVYFRHKRLSALPSVPDMAVGDERAWAKAAGVDVREFRRWCDAQERRRF
mmetsp:Transcript_40793/g.115380  ORF Transcript_40793/g.115380 Transcript_40793/m.115380 type:complete len:81 (+) Transcript_40793:1792-2034(+)